MFKLTEVSEEVKDILLYIYEAMNDANSYTQRGDVIWIGVKSYYVNVDAGCVMYIEEVEDDIPDEEPNEPEPETESLQNKAPIISADIRY